MSPSNVKIKKNHLSMVHPGKKAEVFPISGNPAYMVFTEKGKTRIAIELGTDWIDFEESEFLGGSETIVKVWGIEATEADLKSGRDDLLEPKVKYRKPLGDGVFAWFFGGVGHRVDRLSVRLLGEFRVQIEMMIDDITEETDEPCTADATLSPSNCLLVCPD